MDIPTLQRYEQSDREQDAYKPDHTERRKHQPDFPKNLFAPFSTAGGKEHKKVNGGPDNGFNIGREPILHIAKGRYKAHQQKGKHAQGDAGIERNSSGQKVVCDDQRADNSE